MHASVMQLPNHKSSAIYAYKFHHIMTIPACIYSYPHGYPIAACMECGSQDLRAIPPHLTMQHYIIIVMLPIHNRNYYLKD